VIVVTFFDAPIAPVGEMAGGWIENYLIKMIVAWLHSLIDHEDLISGPFEATTQERL